MYIHLTTGKHAQITLIHNVYRLTDLCYHWPGHLVINHVDHYDNLWNYYDISATTASTSTSDYSTHRPPSKSVRSHQPTSKRNSAQDVSILYHNNANFLYAVRLFGPRSLISLSLLAASRWSICLSLIRAGWSRKQHRWVQCHPRWLLDAHIPWNKSTSPIYNKFVVLILGVNTICICTCKWWLDTNLSKKT